MQKIEILFLQYCIYNKPNKKTNNKMSMITIKVNRAQRAKVLKFIEKQKKKDCCVHCDKIITDDVVNYKTVSGKRICECCVEEEDFDICGETGRECDEHNPLKGCGCVITDDDENLMNGNVSFCQHCYKPE